MEAGHKTEMDGYEWSVAYDSLRATIGSQLVYIKKFGNFC